jgi:hypothetical protein
MTPLGIDPANFQFVAQCLNQLRHRLPLLQLSLSIILFYDKSVSFQQSLVKLLQTNGCKLDNHHVLVIDELPLIINNAFLKLMIYCSCQTVLDLQFAINCPWTATAAAHCLHVPVAHMLASLCNSELIATLYYTEVII